MLRKIESYNRYVLKLNSHEIINYYDKIIRNNSNWHKSNHNNFSVKKIYHLQFNSCLLTLTKKHKKI